MKYVGRLLATCAVLATACAGSRPGEDDFVALQQRGAMAMGVDQYTSTHVFESLPDGGRIELQRDVADPAGVAEIRRHLRHIRQAFSDGNFDIPMFVHDGAVPGTTVMVARKESIRYEYRDLPRGGEVRIHSSDAEVVRAVHEFLAFQRQDHRVSGHEHE